MRQNIEFALFEIRVVGVYQKQPPSMSSYPTEFERLQQHFGHIPARFLTNIASMRPCARARTRASAGDHHVSARGHGEALGPPGSPGDGVHLLAGAGVPDRGAHGAEHGQAIVQEEGLHAPGAPLMRRRELHELAELGPRIRAPNCRTPVSGAGRGYEGRLYQAPGGGR